MVHSRKKHCIFPILSLLLPLAQAAENESTKLDAFELPEVEVVSDTPLGATGLAREKVSGNVQSAEDEDIHRHEALDLSDFMRRNLARLNPEGKLFNKSP